MTQVQFNPADNQKNILCALTEEPAVKFIDCREEKVVQTIDLNQFMGNNKCQALCVCQSEFDENVCYIGLENGIVGKFNKINLKLEAHFDVSK